MLLIYTARADFILAHLDTYVQSKNCRERKKARAAWQLHTEGLSQWNLPNKQNGFAFQYVRRQTAETREKKELHYSDYWLSLKLNALHGLVDSYWFMHRCVHFIKSTEYIQWHWLRIDSYKVNISVCSATHACQKKNPRGHTDNKAIGNQQQIMIAPLAFHRSPSLFLSMCVSPLLFALSRDVMQSYHLNIYIQNPYGF